MIKRLVVNILLLALIQQSNSISGQVLPLRSDSATWYYKSTAWGNPPYTYRHVQYDMLEDTLINNINFTRVFSSLGYTYAYYQDAGRVYAKSLDHWACDTSVFLLYDFNLVANDTFRLYDCNSIEHIVIVSLVDSVSTNQGYKKRIAFSGTQGIEVCHSIDSMVWVESIGSLQDLFYLINFEYISVSMCDQKYEFDSLIVSNGIILHSNIPTEDKNPPLVYIDKEGILRSSVDMKNIQICNVNGKILDEISLFQNTHHLNLSQYSSGLYFILVNCKGSQVLLKYFNE
ncbi:MAG: hypothetical protein EYC69_09995 [Bacteroidetes bacterium]|nr:MAG: hypothetical protein EYC69_09995 [Bacteroidota bacterium]